MTIHERLKAERERLHLSQPSLAERAGVGKTTVINWEKGASAPDAVQLAALATAGADVLYILTGRRSQAVAEVELLPPDEQVLIDSYRRCSPDAKRNLIQSAALLSAGRAPAAAGKKALLSAALRASTPGGAPMSKALDAPGLFYTAGWADPTVLAVHEPGPPAPPPPPPTTPPKG